MKLGPIRLVLCTLCTLAALALAWLFGLPELSALALGIWVCAMIAAGLHRWRRAVPQVRSLTSPASVSRGDPCALELGFDNVVGTRTVPARLRGRFGSAGSGTIGVASLRAGESSGVALTLPTPWRGLMEIGPLHLEYRDPLSIWRSTTPVTTTASVLVRPRTHHLGTLLSGSGPRPGPGERTAAVIGGAEADEDLVGLRPYVRGDDLRRIHWRTSARRNEAHVVQVEPPVLHVPVLILLDTRPISSTESFERSVEVAASIAVAATDLRRPVRLLTTTPGLGERGASSAGTPLGELLDVLAVVNPADGLHPLRAIHNLDEERSTIVCSGDASLRSDADLRRMTDLIVCTADGIPAVGEQPGRQQRARPQRARPQPASDRQARDGSALAPVVDWDGSRALQDAFVGPQRSEVGRSPQ
ncbi:MAG: DUF58 domain-containing protein [Microthrixaceae bacterium]